MPGRLFVRGFHLLAAAMLLARAARASRGASGLPALTGGAARVLCTPSHHPDVHIHPEMPDKWRRLSACRGPHAHSCDART